MDGRLVRGGRTADWKRRRAIGVREKRRPVSSRRRRRGVVLDLAVGALGLIAFDADDAVSCGLCQARRRLKFIDVMLGDQPALTPSRPHISGC